MFVRRGWGSWDIIQKNSEALNTLYLSPDLFSQRFTPNILFNEKAAMLVR